MRSATLAAAALVALLTAARAQERDWARAGEAEGLSRWGRARAAAAQAAGAAAAAPAPEPTITSGMKLYGLWASEQDKLDALVSATEQCRRQDGVPVAPPLTFKAHETYTDFIVGYRLSLPAGAPLESAFGYSLVSASGARPTEKQPNDAVTPELKRLCALEGGEAELLGWPHMVVDEPRHRMTLVQVCKTRSRR